MILNYLKWRTPIELTDSKKIKSLFPNQIEKEFKILTAEFIKKLLKKKSNLGKGATSTVYKVLNCFTNQGFLCLKILNSDLFRKLVNQIEKKDKEDDFGDDDDDDLKDEEESEDEIDVDKVKQLYKEYELFMDSSFEIKNTIQQFSLNIVSSI